MLLHKVPALITMLSSESISTLLSPHDAIAIPCAGYLLVCAEGFSTDHRQ